MACSFFSISLSVFALERHEFSCNKFSFLSSNWKVCPSKIAFSVTGRETEFPVDENSWFSHENHLQNQKKMQAILSIMLNLLTFSQQHFTRAKERKLTKLS